MADEPIPPTTDPAPAPAPAEPSERVFSQAEVGKLLAAERKRARDAALKEMQATPAEPTPIVNPPAAGNNGHDGLARELADLRQELALKDLAVVKGLSSAELQLYKPHLVAAAAEKWAAIVDDFRKSFPAQPHTSTGNPIVPPDPLKAASDRGGPNPPPEAARSDDPRLWTEDYVKRMIASHKTETEGIRAVKDAYYRALAGMTIEFPRRK